MGNRASSTPGDIRTEYRHGEGEGLIIDEKKDTEDMINQFIL